MDKYRYTVNVKRDYVLGRGRDITRVVTVDGPQPIRAIGVALEQIEKELDESFWQDDELEVTITRTQ